MTESIDLVQQLRLELRRGIVVLAVLSQTAAPCYGYGLIQRLGELGLDIEEGTLYPLLRRLEKQGLLQSEWETSEARPRKYYQISSQGREVLAALSAEWFETVAVMGRILNSDTTG